MGVLALTFCPESSTYPTFATSYYQLGLSESHPLHLEKVEVDPVTRLPEGDKEAEVADPPSDGPVPRLALCSGSDVQQD